MLGNFLCFCCHLLIFFSNLTFSKNSFLITVRVSNGLDPAQDRHSVFPGLGSNGLQKLSADNKDCCKQVSGDVCIYTGNHSGPVHPFSRGLEGHELE